MEAISDGNLQPVEQNEGGNWWEKGKKWLTTKEVDDLTQAFCFDFWFRDG